MSKLDVMRNL